MNSNTIHYDILGAGKLNMILGNKEKEFYSEGDQRKLRFTVRMAKDSDWDDAMALAWKTFMRFEADTYTKEGIESFQDFITDPVLKRMFDLGSYQLFVACENEKIIGMISLRNETHISLLFVDEDYHKRGVGRALMNDLCNYVSDIEGYRRVTVNAAPYALGFYHKLGFVDIDREQMKDGIIYTPMEKNIGWR